MFINWIIRKDFNSVNLDDWNGYFGGNVKRDDLNYILYKARTGEIDTLIFAIKKPKYPLANTLKKNSILNYKDTKKATDFFIT